MYEELKREMEIDFAMMISDGSSKEDAWESLRECYLGMIENLCDKVFDEFPSKEIEKD